jgi:hypothetical protein
MQCPPGTPQLLCRLIDQSGNLAIKLGQVRVSQSVLPAAVWTETGRRLARVPTGNGRRPARVLARRRSVDCSLHALAGMAMR